MYALKRNRFDSRSGRDRRRIISLGRFLYKGPDRRRNLNDRRSQEERREGWVRIDKWSSAYLPDLKISRYLRKINYGDK
jgi:hypothetical protein